MAAVEQLFARHERRFLLPASENTLSESERRYLVPRPDALIALLSARVEPASYRVRTEYLQPDVLNKAVEIGVKYRLRYYGDDNVHGWYETKAHQGLFVTKSRHQVEACPPGYARIAGVTYERLAWEIGETRVTLDQGVNDGTATLPGYVLEVKGPRVPRWLRPLLPPRERSFSKRKWATARAQSEVA